MNISTINFIRPLKETELCVRMFENRSSMIDWINENRSKIDLVSILPSNIPSLEYEVFFWLKGDY